jgi:hypothetical protein
MLYNWALVVVSQASCKRFKCLNASNSLENLSCLFPIKWADVCQTMCNYFQLSLRFHIWWKTKTSHSLVFIMQTMWKKWILERWTFLPREHHSSRLLRKLVSWTYNLRTMSPIGFQLVTLEACQLDELVDWYPLCTSLPLSGSPIVNISMFFILKTKIFRFFV